MANPKTHACRVVIREITYASKGKNILDQPEVQYKTAYGPGRPEINPVTLLGPEHDPQSEEGKKAAKDFKLGELVHLLDQDYIRLKNGGAVMDADAREAQVVEEEEIELDVRTASVDELARWIETDKPTVQEVVDASGGEADLAQKLLEAESQATDGDPRTSLVDALSTVIGRG